MRSSREWTIRRDRSRPASGLNARMNRYREVWMRRMLDREMRMGDSR